MNAQIYTLQQQSNALATDIMSALTAVADLPEVALDTVVLDSVELPKQQI